MRSMRKGSRLLTPVCLNEEFRQDDHAPKQHDKRLRLETLANPGHHLADAIAVLRAFAFVVAAECLAL